MTNHSRVLLALLVTGLASAGAATDSETMTDELEYGLIGIGEMDVVVEVDLHSATGGDAVDFSAELREMVQSRLAEAGIRLVWQVSEQDEEALASAVREATARRLDVDPNSLTWRKAAVILRVVVDVLILQEDGPVVLHVQTSLARPVRLDGWDGRSFEATVWGCEPEMESVPSSSWPDEVRKTVLRQTESFIDALEVARQYENDPPVLFRVSALPRNAVAGLLAAWCRP